MHQVNGDVPSVRQNTAAFPTASYNHQSLIFSMDPGEKEPSIAIMAVLFALAVPMKCGTILEGVWT
jgi:hypothetical protein